MLIFLRFDRVRSLLLSLYLQALMWHPRAQASGSQQWRSFFQRQEWISMLFLCSGNNKRSGLRNLSHETLFFAARPEIAESSGTLHFPASIFKGFPAAYKVMNIICDVTDAHAHLFHRIPVPYGHSAVLECLIVHCY